MKLEYYIIQVIINKLLHIQIGEDNYETTKKNNNKKLKQSARS